MQKKKLKINTKILIAIASAGLILFAFLLFVQSMVDTRNYSDQIRQVIKEKTGRDVIIKGRVSVSLLPLPTLYIPGMEIRDAPNDKPAPAISIGMIGLSIAPTSLFSEQPVITAVTLNQLTLELVRAHDNYIHWDWLNSGLLKALASSKVTGDAVALDVVQGKIMYIDKRTDKSLYFENISIHSEDIASLDINGTFNVYGSPVNFMVNTRSDGEQKLPKHVRPLHVRIDAGDKGSMNLNGTLDPSGEAVVVKGKFDAATEDMMRWVKARAKKLEEEQEVFDKLQQRKVMADELESEPLPLKVSAEWDQQGGAIVLDDFTLEGLNSNGSGKMKLGWQKWYPVISANLEFAGLDYNQWNRLFRGLFIDENAEAKKRLYQGSDYQPENPIPEDIQMKLKVSSEQLFVTSQIWKNFDLSAQMSEASVTINNFSVDLPGESNLMVFGIISQGSTGGGLRFEGSMETLGKSLRQMLTIFDESASDLPETGFGDFFARANMFISSEQVRLSEANVKLSDLRLNGGLVAYFDSSPRLEADVKLKDINFDYFRDVWREKNKKTKEEEFFLRFDRTMKFNWLKNLQTNIDLKVGVDKFTFLERPGDSASFRIFVKPYEFGIYDMRFNYPYETLQASFNLNVQGEQPYINVVLNTNELDMNYFHLEPQQLGVNIRPSNTFKGIKGAIPPEDEMTDVVTFVGIEGAELPEDGIVGIDSSFIGVEGARLPGEEEYMTEGGVPAEGSEEETQEIFEVTPQASTTVLALNEVSDSPSAADEDKEESRTSETEIPLDMSYIERDENGVATTLWSTKLIDMGWMQGFNGAFDISIGRLIAGRLVLDRLKMQAKLDNDLLSFQNLAFIYWQGRCSVLGSVFGGKVPGISLSFTLFNIELGDMFYEMTGRNNITGKASVSGTLTTSGVNTLSWVSQSEAKLVFAGRGVNVNGINLQGVVDTLMISRTAADVFNNVNIAFINGDTTFTVDGNINVRGGVMRTPGITMRTGNITGVLTGDVKLVPWKMDLSTLFQFPTITSETIPTMTVVNAGPVEDTDLRTDTSSLEAYVAKRIISK